MYSRRERNRKKRPFVPWMICPSARMEAALSAAKDPPSVDDLADDVLPGRRPDGTAATPGPRTERRNEINRTDLRDPPYYRHPSRRHDRRPPRAIRADEAPT